jgi:hypothetical protein
MLAAICATPIVMAFHQLFVAEFSCLIATMSLAMYLRAFYSPRQAWSLVLLLCGLCLLALAIAPAPKAATTYVIVPIAIVGAAESFGVVTRALITAACSDPLTGLLNRAGWEIATNELMARSRSESLTVTVITLDLDGFKQLNDTYGHVAGDDHLIGRAQLLGDSRSSRCSAGQTGWRRIRRLYRRPRAGHGRPLHLRCPVTDTRRKHRIGGVRGRHRRYHRFVHTRRHSAVQRQRQDAARAEAVNPLPRAWDARRNLSGVRNSIRAKSEVAHHHVQRADDRQQTLAARPTCRRRTRNALPSPPYAHNTADRGGPTEFRRLADMSVETGRYVGGNGNRSSRAEVDVDQNDLQRAGQSFGITIDDE